MCQNKLFHSIEFVTCLRRVEESAGTSFQTIGFGIGFWAMEKVSEQAFQTIRIGINHRAMDSIWTLLTSLYIED